MLGAVFILALSPCSGTAPSGERKESSPQLRLPPRSGEREVTVLIVFCNLLLLLPLFLVPSESRLAQPLTSFSSLCVVVSLSLLNSLPSFGTALTL